MTVYCNVPLSAPNYTFSLEPAGREERKSGGERKSADVERKTVILIYPYPNASLKYQYDLFLQMLRMIKVHKLRIEDSGFESLLNFIIVGLKKYQNWKVFEKKRFSFRRVCIINILRL